MRCTPSQLKSGSAVVTKFKKKHQIVSTNRQAKQLCSIALVPRRGQKSHNVTSVKVLKTYLYIHGMHRLVVPIPKRNAILFSAFSKLVSLALYIFVCRMVNNWRNWLQCQAEGAWRSFFLGERICVLLLSFSSFSRLFIHCCVGGNFWFLRAIKWLIPVQNCKLGNCMQEQEAISSFTMCHHYVNQYNYRKD